MQTQTHTAPPTASPTVSGHHSDLLRDTDTCTPPSELSLEFKNKFTPCALCLLSSFNFQSGSIINRLCLSVKCYLYEVYLFRKYFYFYLFCLVAGHGYNRSQARMFTNCLCCGGDCSQEIWYCDILFIWIIFLPSFIPSQGMLSEHLENIIYHGVQIISWCHYFISDLVDNRKECAGNKYHINTHVLVGIQS